MKTKVIVPKARCFPIHPQTHKMLGILDKHPDFDVEIRPGLYIYQNRNYGITDLHKYDYYLFVDSDVSVWNPVDAIQRLMDRNVYIVGGAYPERGSEGRFCAYDLINGENKSIASSIIGLRQVFAVGAGFLLVKKEVFEVMEQPYFRHITMPAMGDQCGEDLGFCLEAGEKGFKVYCDCDVRLEHHMMNYGS